MDQSILSLLFLLPQVYSHWWRLLVGGVDPVVMPQFGEDGILRREFSFGVLGADHGHVCMVLLTIAADALLQHFVHACRRLAALGAPLFRIGSGGFGEGVSVGNCMERKIIIINPREF